MTDVLWAGLIAATVQVVGILLNSRLTAYRIKQLEEKVNKHNGLIERMYVVEESTKSAHHRIDEIRKGIVH